MSDIDSPRKGALDLCTAFAKHFGRVGVFPQIVDGSRKAGLAAEQRWRVRDGTPAVGGVLAVEREVHTDVVGWQVTQRGVTRPWRWHHQRSARSNTGAQRKVHAVIRGMARTEVVTRNDDETIGAAVPKSFGESAHCLRRYPLQAAHRPRFVASASRAA